MKTFIFMGRSGSGKGTQARLLIDWLKSQTPSHAALYIETGNLVRQFMQGDSWSQKQARVIVNNGGFLPAFMAINNWANFLREQYRGDEYLLVDGTPRTYLEAEAFDGALEFYGAPASPRALVIVLEVTPDEIVRRLAARGRNDDTPEAIRSRLSEFDKKVKPVLDYYRQNPNYRFITINGNRSIEEIAVDVRSLLS